MKERLQREICEALGRILGPQGEIPEFTGISAPYEAPEKPELVLDTAKLSVEESVAKLVGFLEEQGYLSPR